MRQRLDLKVSSGRVLSVLAAFAGAVVGAGVVFYFYIYQPRQLEFARIENCAVAPIPALEQDLPALAGTDLHRFLIANSSRISSSSPDIFFISGGYRKEGWPTTASGSYLVTGNRACAFANGHADPMNVIMIVPNLRPSSYLYFSVEDGATEYSFEITL